MIEANGGETTVPGAKEGYNAIDISDSKIPVS